MSSLTNLGSTVRGGGNVTVKATGGAQKDANGNIVDGDISVIGSAISAGGTATLDANRNVNLQASTDHLQQSTQSSGSSWGVQAASPSLGDLGRWVVARRTRVATARRRTMRAEQFGRQPDDDAANGGIGHG
jgi:filamentous hemagglutinin